MILIYILTGLILSLGILYLIKRYKIEFEQLYDGYGIYVIRKRKVNSIIVRSFSNLTTILFIWIGIIIGTRIGYHKELKQFKSVKLECNGWETLDCGIKAYEQNDWLRKAKLQRTKIFRIFVPKQVDNESEIFSNYHK